MLSDLAHSMKSQIATYDSAVAGFCRSDVTFQMLSTRVVQREGLTVQRHRHTSDGSCYGVTVLFHGVSRC
jgi:hypothetical protein